MNLRKLKKAFGREVRVTRDRKQKITTAEAGGLSYRAHEGSFKNEGELAEYVRSKVPVALIPPRQ